MPRRPSTAIHPDAQAIHSRVLRGIAGNRVAGLHFPGYFLDFQWQEVAGETAHMTLADGPHCRDARGEIDIAAASAGAAAPATMLLSNVSAWYISPGHGRALAVKSRVVHAGRTVAVIRTEIKTAAGERVLEAVTHHVARKRARLPETDTGGAVARRRRIPPPSFD